MRFPQFSLPSPLQTHSMRFAMAVKLDLCDMIMLWKRAIDINDGWRSLMNKKKDTQSDYIKVSVPVHGT